MKALLAGLLLTVSLSSFAGAIAISGHEEGNIQLTFTGDEAKEIYHRLEAKEELKSSSSSIGYALNSTSTTHQKVGKNISCYVDRSSFNNKNTESFTCRISVDGKGRIKPIELYVF